MTPTETTEIELSPAVERLAIENFRDSLKELPTEQERVAALAIIEALAPMARDRRVVCLAIAKIMTAEDDYAEYLAKMILRQP